MRQHRVICYRTRLYVTYNHLYIDIGTTSAEVSTLEVGKQVTNSSSTTSGVARCYPTATSERGRGWVGYLPSSHIARSEASEHAIARVTIHRQDPTTLTYALRRPFNCGCTTRAFGALLVVDTRPVFNILLSVNHFNFPPSHSAR